MTAPVLITVEGHVGRLRLNRPKALHALDLPMCAAMLEALLAWATDTAIDLVVIDHAEGRGFCAGGDVRKLAQSGAADGKAAAAFFHTEYRLNHLLFTYPKPTVAFMDGVTMGGGVGISQPCRYRVATEATRFAMPESGIGLFPDVGGGWYLSRLPGRLGAWLALTGARLDGGDCRALGLADHYLDSATLEDVKRELIARPLELEAILATHEAQAPPSRTTALRPLIDRLFVSEKLEAIYAMLEQDSSDWAREQRTILAAKSNVTCKVSLRLISEGAAMTSFADEMRSEYRIASRICRQHDFIEGVRALLVDKDNAPHWDPATPEGVPDATVDALFAPLPSSEEWTPVELGR
ncbi:enoyl-CoA hydratase/isomerase family protein [Xanthomonas hyacinthi]|uniref:3-hydroxyisobutyryl-CoA hydrolase n=1 Tax=Xanthomonas hyacinthi TaxID=56455 RepID=A0A2S7F1S3_9XANT|nr:enoyl-CoA hydratase/isomerase family protein [Xanthomonas hyacinthi]KLD79011.1 enoyl-CoA hydratase [Xanthomonas hyacinthi DSM 19077]PPU99375.1 enoyl-CoA hydratase/isomerase family protein [Xanthomonas hyacinthi]QGY78368.1 enoyl-CoA hydratase/isomerase family protein [Xanthomonas hyacinthi]